MNLILFLFFGSIFAVIVIALLIYSSSDSSSILSSNISEPNLKNRSTSGFYSYEEDSNINKFYSLEQMISFASSGVTIHWNYLIDSKFVRINKSTIIKHYTLFGVIATVISAVERITLDDEASRVFIFITFLVAVFIAVSDVLRDKMEVVERFKAYFYNCANTGHKYYSSHESEALLLLKQEILARAIQFSGNKKPLWSEVVDFPLYSEMGWIKSNVLGRAGSAAIIEISPLIKFPVLRGFAVYLGGKGYISFVPASISIKGTTETILEMIAKRVTKHIPFEIKANISKMVQTFSRTSKWIIDEDVLVAQNLSGIDYFMSEVGGIEYSGSTDSLGKITLNIKNSSTKLIAAPSIAEKIRNSMRDYQSMALPPSHAHSVSVNTMPHAQPCSVPGVDSVQNSAKYSNNTTCTSSALEKVCPMCAETIKAAAKICRFCQHKFVE